MATDPTGFTVVQAQQALARGDISSSELTQACIDAIMEANPALNILAGSVDVDKSVAMAKASDARRARKEPAGALDGIPVGIKDIFCVRGQTATACSRILSGFVPDYESTVTERLWQAGAIMSARLNMDEFAMGSSSQNSVHGPVVSPWRRRGDTTALSAGGSSGGSAAAVAARLVPSALGTDTGGSIRQPASLTGVVGMKPSYGRASRYGMIAFSSSLDQAGTLTRTVADAAEILKVICGADARDSTTSSDPVPDWSAHIGSSIKGMRIGIPSQYRLEDTPAEVGRMWEEVGAWLTRAGAQLIPISLPHTRYALPAYYVISPAEASSNLARYDGMRFGERVEGSDLIDTYQRTRAVGFGDEVQRRLLIGGYVLSTGYYDAYFLCAQKVRARVAADFAEVFGSVEAILTPTAPSGAFALGEKMSDPVSMYLNDVFTVPASLAGLPAISVPAMLDADGLPLGIQVLADRCDESSVFRVASAIEREAGFTHTPERWW